MRYSITLLFFLFLTQTINAQYLEVGAIIGTSAYSGELTEQRFPDEGFHGTLGVFGRYNISERFSAKATFSKYKVSGTDVNARLIANRERNLSFRSDILEFSLLGEVNLMKFNIRDNRGSVPYFTTGLSVFYFNPQAQLNGEWHNLEPLHTEGSGYKKVGVAIPFGLGFKFNLSYKVNFGVELGYRKTFTDKIDDISGFYPDIQEMRGTSLIAAALAYRTPELNGGLGENPAGNLRGNSEDDDSYMYATLTISVNLTDKYGLDFDEKYESFKTKEEKKLTPYEKRRQHQKAVKAKKKARQNEMDKKKKAKVQGLKNQVKKAKKDSKGKKELGMPAKKRKN